jgi:hypothetical protein
MGEEESNPMTCPGPDHYGDHSGVGGCGGFGDECGVVPSAPASDVEELRRVLKHHNASPILMQSLSRLAFDQEAYRQLKVNHREALKRIEELERALEEIANMAWDSSSGRKMRDIARAALGKEES